MRSFSCAIAFAVVTVCGISQAFSAPIVIDSFTVGTLNYTANGANAVNGTNQTGVDTPDGRRASSIDHLFNPGVATVTMNNGPITASADNFVLSLGYGATYSSGGFSTTPDLNADLSGTGAFKISFAAGSSSAGIQTYMFTHRGGVYGEIDDNGHGVGKPGGAVDVIIPYSALTDSFSGGVDFSDIDSIVFTFQAQGALTITQISAIPEPLGAGWLLCAAGVMRLRRHRSA